MREEGRERRGEGKGKRKGGRGGREGMGARGKEERERVGDWRNGGHRERE